MEQNDISNLLKRYEQMLTSGKNVYFDADEFDELADYYDKLDDIETAKEIVKSGLNIHPNNESLILRHAKFLVYDANYGLALQNLNSHFNNYSFESHLLKIECLLQLGTYTEAHSLTMEVLQDEETEIDIILSELGFIYIEAEYLDEAILYFEKSLEYNPENIEVLNDLAYAYEVKGDFTAAITTSEKILDIDPYLFDVWLMLGKLYSLQGNYEKAIDAFDFSLTLDDTNIYILKLKAHCLLLSDRLEEALEILQSCILSSPEDSPIYLSLIECHINLENYEEAESLLKDYEDKFGESSESILQKAFIFFLNDNITSAEQLIERAVKKGNDSPAIYKIAGDIYMKFSSLDKAEELYKKALSIEKEDTIFEKIISLYIRKNDFINAIKYQKKLNQLTGSNPIDTKLALLYLETSDKENFDEQISLFDNQTLLSFFRLFYPQEDIDIHHIDRPYLLRRLEDVYQNRLLYKNIKY